MIIIPIGLQCTTATFKKKIDKSSHSLPFDWMFATPKFVFEMLELLLDKDMNINELVEKHFFLCEKRASMSTVENYHSDDEGNSLYNVKYKSIFPHDAYTQETIDKYIRRFYRLKELISNSDEKICFIYSSQSSLHIGNFTIDGENVICDVYTYLSKIYTLIGKYNNNYKLILFDAVNEDDKTLLHEDIVLCKLNQANIWGDILSQMDNYKNLLE
jgi:hypothetical protein